MKSSDLSLLETAQWLSAHNDFLILTHRRPDGDTLGSAAGLCVLLRTLGKRAYVLENPETTARYAPYVRDYHASADFQAKTIVSVDTADAAILASNAQCYAERVDLSIDHHGSNTGYAAYRCLNAARAACGEVIYELARLLCGEISPALALPLYVAVATDTGCFLYGNVTPDTMRIAGSLMQTGIDAAGINKTLFHTKSRARIALEGALYSNLQYAHDGRLAISVVTQALLAQTRALEDDMDDIANLPNQVAGVCIGITVKEVPEGGACKISVRSLPGIDANAICKQFGGGGHKQAAGCLIKSTPEEAVRALIAAVEAEI